MAVHVEQDTLPSTDFQLQADTSIPAPPRQEHAQTFTNPTLLPVLPLKHHQGHTPHQDGIPQMSVWVLFSLVLF